MESAGALLDRFVGLGDALVLCRLVFSFSELTGVDLPFGAVDKEAIVLIQADTPTRHSRVEEFAANHLGDAVDAYGPIRSDAMHRAGSSGQRLRLEEIEDEQPAGPKRLVDARKKRR